MLVPLSWLKDFVSVDRPTAELSDAFNDLGLVVEGIEQSGEGLDDVVTALVRSIRKHPNADRMRLIDVVTAEDQAETLQVACGAFNFNEGDRVPLAKVGAVLPGDFKIERAKKRGEWSNGMLCSARELRLSDDHEGILVLDAGTTLGIPIAEALGIVKDTVIDLSVDANRPYAMCIAGVARDLAAKLGVGFTFAVDAAPVMSAPAATVTRGSISATDLCDRLTTTVIRNVTVTESPDLIKRRLLAAGMRPINNLVDASNYVVLELGAPSHAFDLDKLAGGRIGVRWARVGETITTLDGNERRLGENGAQDGVIVDGSDTAVGIAAIMGGASSEVDETTRNLLVEIAHWTPMCIARSSKRMGLRSEASARFERGTDPEMLPRAAARFLELVRLTSANATVESFDDIRPVASAAITITLRTARANLVLGTDLDDAAIVRLITPIGFVCVPTNPGECAVTIPSWRPDATEEINVIEEVGRHFGYRNIARRTLTNDRVGQLTDYQKQRRRVSSLLTSLGCNEAWTATLIGPPDLERSGLPNEAVALSNPMAKEESLLRTELLPGLLRTLSYNNSHRNAAVRVFEIGHVFGLPRPNQVVPYEREHLAVALAADGDDARAAVRMFDALVESLRIKPEAVALKAGELAGLHATRTARIIGTGTGFPIGAVGEIDPAVLAAWAVDRRVGWLQVDLGNLCALAKRDDAVSSFSVFPSSDVDLAFVVADATSAADVEEALRLTGGGLLLSVQLFDVYRGERIADGSRGLTYRLRFGAADRTLTDADLAAVRDACIDGVAKNTGATLRA